jgi:predicted nuclease of restriction endonuclease-like (RecB) superfamily
MRTLVTDESYINLLEEVKLKIKQAQINAMIVVNHHLLILYWQIGNMILERQKTANWGDKVLSQLSIDIKLTYPNIQGYSVRNLKYMRAFARENPSFEIGQVPLAQISWYHNITLIEKIPNQTTRLWYAQKAIENGWSRDVMLTHIESHLHLRQGNSVNNFAETMPKIQSDLAQEIMKDPYLFDFLTLRENALEKELEEALIKHIVQFLLELGQGFAFVGRQYILNIAGDDYKIDLLFYHLRLRCFVVIDLKTRHFIPEDAGKMNFYVNALDDILKTEQDNQTIGLILCKDKNKIKAEYALRGIKTPIGVSEFRLTEILPDEFKSSLPSIEDIEQTLTSYTKNTEVSKTQKSTPVMG